ncbi:MAG: xanthine dehydrogenase small subunit [Pseudomonadota bacterium]|jgi:xanthine dehydrogenase small subunit
MQRLRFFVNGRVHEPDGPSPTTTLLRYLRDKAGLCGTKEGCAEGDCGACSVAVADVRADGTETWRSVNACLVLLPMVQGRSVRTVEGLKDGDALHPVQETLARHMGSQCGYCTPGIVMSMFEAAHRDDLTEPWQVDDQMCGNLCRCTGYRPIREAAKEVAGTCRGTGPDAAPRESMALHYAAGDQRYFNPATLAELFELLHRYPEARLVAGGTDLSLEVTKKFQRPPLLVSVESVPELRRTTADETGWTVGSAATLTEVQEAMGTRVPALEKMLRWFASRPIRNRATVGGNLCTASPIGDLPPVLIALGAEVTLASRSGHRTMPLEQFFTGYRRTALLPGEILASVRIPRTPSDLRVSSFKVSKRRELDISAVSAGLAVRLDANGVVTEARLAYGGMAAVPKRASKAEAVLVGRSWSEETVRAAMEVVDGDFEPLSDHRASRWYRSEVARNLLLGFFLETQGGGAVLEDRPTSTVALKVVG